MSLNPSISSSQNALVINLAQVEMEEIVEKKLLYFLSRDPIEQKKQNPQGQNILKVFYEPSEQALIEFSLEKLKGNQFKTAKALGINRNTLKKKIVGYNLNIKELLIKQKDDWHPQSRIFLSSAESLNLLSACRAKLATADSQNKIPQNNMLKKICQPVERRIIQRVLERFKGNQIRASHFLGINRNTLKKKMSCSLEERAG